MSGTPKDSGWEVFNIAELMKHVDIGEDASYYEFIRRSSLSCAVYRLPVGCKDMQSPHLEDEVYVVLEGSARLRVGDDTQVVGRGSILYVRANTSHSFFDIEEDLTVLVFFGAVPGSP